MLYLIIILSVGLVACCLYINSLTRRINKQEKVINDLTTVIKNNKINIYV